MLRLNGGGGGFFLESQIAWAPVLDFHEPNPPITLEDAVVQPLDLPHVVRKLSFRPLARSRYLFHYAQDLDAPAPPADVPDGGSNLQVVPVWDGFRLARARGFYYQGRNDAPPPPEPETLAPHLVRVPFKGFRPNRHILTSRRDDTAPPEPPGGPPHPPRGRPFRRDGGLGFEEGARYRRNRYLWNASVETLQLIAADAPASFLVRTQYRAFRTNRHIFHYYFAQPPAPPVGGFKAGWADDSTITINMRRIDRGVIA